MIQRVAQNAGYELIAEYRFAPPRRWRFDYAILEPKIALEVDGGVWSGGRHTRGKGFIADMEKFNCAASLGWRIFRCLPGQELVVWDLIEQTLNALGSTKSHDRPQTKPQTKTRKRSKL